MTVRVYTSGDAGAPALRGNTGGDLINLLHKVLVEGYGDHLPAGWTRPFVNGDVAVFKTGEGSNGMCLRIDDSHAHDYVTTYRYARVSGFENMSDINTGTGQFPTQDQQDGGLYWHMHYPNSSQTKARAWTIYADEKFFILNISTHTDLPVLSSYRETYWFGDYVSTMASDPYSTVIYGKRGYTEVNSSESAPYTSSGPGSPHPGSYFPRSYTGLGGSQGASLIHDSAKSGQSTWGGTSALPYPHGPDGALMLSPIWIMEPGNSSNTSAAIRGTMPGMWAPLQAVLGHGDKFDGQGELVGRKFQAMRQYESRLVVETTDNWR